MPARTKPVRAALPGFAFAAVLLLAGCGGTSHKASAAPLTRASSLCGQVASSRSTGEMGWARASSSSASASCRVSSTISVRPARPGLSRPQFVLRPRQACRILPHDPVGQAGLLPPRQQATSTCIRRSGTPLQGRQQIGVAGEQHESGVLATKARRIRLTAIATSMPSRLAAGSASPGIRADAGSPTRRDEMGPSLKTRTRPVTWAGRPDLNRRLLRPEAK